MVIVFVGEIATKENLKKKYKPKETSLQCNSKTK